MELIHRGRRCFGKRTRKPNSVLGPFGPLAVIPLGAASPRTLISDLPGGFEKSLNPLNASGRCVAAAWLEPAASLPIWSCSVWGLPCLRHCCRSGALLPHLFTLTPAPSLTARSVQADWLRGAPVKRVSRGGMFSVALAVREPSRSRPGRYPAHCPAEFGLSSPGVRQCEPRQRPPGPPARTSLPRIEFARGWLDGLLRSK